MTRRVLYHVLWVAVAMACVGLVLHLFQSSARDVAADLAGAPMSLYAMVAGLAVLMQVFGALKWRVAHTALTDRPTGRSFWSLTEITTLGSLGAQFLPAQLSHLIVRWFYSPKDGNHRVEAASSTLYEQFCDLILFVVLSLVFLVWFWLRAPIWMVLPLGLLSLFFPRLILKAALWLLQLGVRRLGRVGPLTTAMAKAEALVVQSGRISGFANTQIFALSGAIILVRGAQAYLIIRALAPAADALMAAAAFPVTGLIAAIPISPAGLGVTELSWSAFLIAAGASAPVAASTALSIRLINLIVLVVIMAASVALRLAARTTRPA